MRSTRSWASPSAVVKERTGKRSALTLKLPEIRSKRNNERGSGAVARLERKGLARRSLPGKTLALQSALPATASRRGEYNPPGIETLKDISAPGGAVDISPQLTARGAGEPLSYTRIS